MLHLIKSQSELDSFNRATHRDIRVDTFPVFITDGFDILTEDYLNDLLENIKRVKFSLDMM